MFTFATVGDTRQDPTKPDATTLVGSPKALLPQDKMWLQNTKAWSRIIREVQAKKSNMLFVNGDLIMGYGRATPPATLPASATAWANADISQFYMQYAYWRGMTANMLETGTYVIPVPGNHEVQCSSAVTTNGVYHPGDVATATGCLTGALSGTKYGTGKYAYTENENAWRANMGDLIGDLSTNTRFGSVISTFSSTPLVASNVAGLTASTAPTSTTETVATTGGTITTDQSQLSYSFDVSTSGGLLHFAVINTDPTGADGTAPAGWLQADFDAAAARGVTAGKAVKYFVFGHKPAFTYIFNGSTVGTTSGFDANTTNRNAFWKAMAQYHGTYFCGHEHVYNLSSFADPTNTYTSYSPYQVLVGSGGSPFDAATAGTSGPQLTDRYYAYAVVRVQADGTVTLQTYGFNDAFGQTVTLSGLSPVTL